jgi:hypothetical protein
MRKTVRLLATGILLVLGTAPVAAAESTQSTTDSPQIGASDSDQGKHTGTAECPIKKTIDGKTYCFQNDPALTKRQGGGD